MWHTLAIVFSTLRLLIGNRKIIIVNYYLSDYKNSR